MTGPEGKIPEWIRENLCDLNSRASGATRCARKVVDALDELVVYNDDGWAQPHLRELARASSRLISQAITYQEAIGERVQPDVPF